MDYDPDFAQLLRDAERVGAEAERAAAGNAQQPTQQAPQQAQEPPAGSPDTNPPDADLIALERRLRARHAEAQHAAELEKHRARNEELFRNIMHAPPPPRQDNPADHGVVTDRAPKSAHDMTPAEFSAEMMAKYNVRIS
jgi:hypothetical protein